MNLPPSGRRSKKSVQLLNKEQEFKDLNAALEEKTANLISEAESVLKAQNILFSEDTTADEFDSSENVHPSSSMSHYLSSESTLEDPVKSKSKPAVKTSKVSKKQRPVSVPGSGGRRQTGMKTLKDNNRSQSSKGMRANEISPFNLLEERAVLANQISALEIAATDDIYTPSADVNDEILPEAANDIGPEATIRFLKAKLRVMQEELEATVTDSRAKVSKIAKMEKSIKEKEEENLSYIKKIDQLQNTIEKHKANQEEIRTKNNQLESEVSTLKRDLDAKKRENKQTSANRNTIELRLNRALEEAEKYKSALQQSKESTKMVNDKDRKKMEQLEVENKRLQKQKEELMNAFKKQLKLIEVLKKQKLHIEAAKLLEFSEEEFLRALDWGKS